MVLTSQFINLGVHYGTKLPGFSSDPGKNVRPSAIQNCPRNILFEFFARVTREPGDFDIITQEFRFSTLYTNRTVIMDRHD